MGVGVGSFVGAIGVGGTLVGLGVFVGLGVGVGVGNGVGVAVGINGPSIFDVGVAVGVAVCVGVGVNVPSCPRLSGNKVVTGTSSPFPSFMITLLSMTLISGVGLLEFLGGVQVFLQPPSTKAKNRHAVVITILYDVSIFFKVSSSYSAC